MDTRSAAALGFHDIRNMLADCALSTSGKAAAREIAASFDAEEVAVLLAQTKEAETISRSRSSYPMMSFSDVTSEISRLRSQADLNCAELLSLNLLLKAAKKAHAGITPDEERNIVLLPKMAENLFFDSNLINRIEASIISEDEVADDASPALRTIRRKMRSENDSIREKLNGIIRSREYGKYLQDTIITQRNGRYVVPVKLEYRNVIKGLVHGESGSGATLFIEPMSVVESNNRLRLLEDEEKHEIERILGELSDYFRPYTDALTDDMEILTKLDLIFAKSTLADRMKASPCEASADGGIHIKNGRHPLIDEKKVIPVTVDFGGNTNTVVITGPNTGGKTVTLKLVGLFALMAQSGMYIPASYGSSLPIFTGVFCDIGDEQSIEQSLSTFSSHMKNITQIIDEAERGGLVLLDELGAGTDPEEGACLGMSILKELCNRRIKTLATTHYSEIKAYALTEKHFLNASMEFDAASLRPTYRLIIGVAGASNAMLISKSLGLRKSVIDRAMSFMRQERIEFDTLLAEAEKTRMRALSELEKAEEMQRYAKKVEKKAKQMEAEFEEKRSAALKKANEEAYEIISKAKEESEKLIKEIRRTRNMTESESTKIVDSARKALSEQKDKAKEKIKQKPKAFGKKLTAEEIRLGDSVRILTLDAEGTVTQLPDSRGNVGVRAGILTMNVKISDLELLDNSGKKQVVASTRVRLAQKSISLSVNLQGMNVEDALIELNQYLDDAFLSGLKEVSVVHGKGSGILRSNVHTFLRKHPHVENFRLGKYGEGETGVTIVTLK